MADKLVILVTCGPEDAERATLPFVMATSAQASDVEVLMGFQGSGAWLALKSLVGHIQADGFPPLKDLMDAFIEEGGKLYVCGPCVKSRDIKEEDFVDGATIVNAATFVAEVTEATSTLVYKS
jgi:predicted peroxiredoxin